METGYEAILFDLDGTLLDTAGDLVAAVNVLLEKHEQSALPVSRLRPWVSQGGLTLVSMAFDISRESAQAQELWQQYLVEYAAKSNEQTVLFNGLEGVLQSIEKSGRPWGIVTNKPEFLTIPLLQNIGLSKRTNCIVGGDTVTRGKPWPDPVLYACDLLHADPNNCLIIGDDIRDIQAGQAAGLATIAAAWGYIRPDDDPHTWGADVVIEQPDQLRGWID
jgi:2-phosphoglycolate phosphatase